MNEAASIELLTVDLVLGFAVLEAMVLAICCRRAARGPSFASLVPNLMAGLCLMMAVRSAILADGWLGLAPWLAAAGAAHAVDLWMRWRRSVPARPATALHGTFAATGKPLSAAPTAAALSLPDVASDDAICRQPSPASRKLENVR